MIRLPRISIPGIRTRPHSVTTSRFSGAAISKNERSNCPSLQAASATRYAYSDVLSLRAASAAWQSRKCAFILRLLRSARNDRGCLDIRSRRVRYAHRIFATKIHGKIYYQGISKVLQERTASANIKRYCERSETIPGTRRT